MENHTVVQLKPIAKERGIRGYYKLRKANFIENVPANTRAFALVISDKMLSFQSDGNKMSVIY